MITHYLGYQISLESKYCGGVACMWNVVLDDFNLHSWIFCVLSLMCLHGFSVLSLVCLLGFSAHEVSYACMDFLCTEFNWYVCMDFLHIKFDMHAWIFSREVWYGHMNFLCTNLVTKSGMLAGIFSTSSLVYYYHRSSAHDVWYPCIDFVHTNYDMHVWIFCARSLVFLHEFSVLKVSYVCMNLHHMIKVW